MILSTAALRRLVKTQNKRVGKDYIYYLNKKVEEMVQGHIRMLGSRGTLKARDFIFLDGYNKKGR